MPKPKKLFLSYSHKDEAIVEEFRTHLSNLRRQDVIAEWYDRMIPIGSEWKNQIDTKLKDAEIIIFVVSADFIASKYCYEIEMMEAMKQHDLGISVVIPLIIRACDWEDTPFAKIQAAPTDAKPISEWKTSDDFFLDTVRKIKGLVKIGDSPKKSSQSILGEDRLTKEFVEHLNDTEIVFAHRNVNKVTLEDIFVTPDLKVLTDNLKKAVKSLPGVAIAESRDSFIIVGDEQSGKTALAKRLFMEILSKGQSPLFLDGADLKFYKLEKIIGKAKSAQYRDLENANFNLSNSTVIVDDFSKVNVSKNELNKITSYLNENFSQVILFADDAFEFIAREDVLEGEFTLCRVLPLSNKRRAELTEKWILIGAEDIDQDENYFRQIDKLMRHLDQFVVKNSVPSRPVLLVSLLQSAETWVPTRSELTNYGHCYQFIIYQALERSNISAHVIDSCFNYLTELAGISRLSPNRKISTDELISFKKEYCKKYIAEDIDEMHNALVSSSILKNESGQIRFKYRYFLYFFIGKFLADGLASGSLQKKSILNLIETIHREESSNVLLYICHHSRDPWVIDEIQLALLALFDVEQPATLSFNDLAYIAKFVEKLPELVVERRDHVVERELHYKKKDQYELTAKTEDEEFPEGPDEDFLATINRLFKGIELTGQIVRSKYGSLEKDTIKSLIRESYEASFRFLNYFLETVEAIEHEVLESLEWMISRDVNCDKKILEKRAKDLYVKLNYYLIFGTVIRVAESVGTQAAMSVCYEVEREIDTFAARLVTTTMELQFLKKMNFERLNKLNNDAHDNVVVQRLLKEIVVRHTYLHPVDYKTQQKVADLLDISSDRMQLSRASKALRVSK